MDYTEDTIVELKDGRRGLIVEVRVNGHTQYDIELPNGELTTVYHGEVKKRIIPTTK